MDERTGCPNPLNYIEISREALRYNAETVKQYVGVPIIGVVKCNGYGVSLLEAAAAWKDAGVTMFGVSEPQEAAELREAGFKEDILLLSPVADENTLKKMLEYRVILTVTGIENARFYSEHAEKWPIWVHVAVDTGMGRFGVRWTDIAQLKEIYQMQCFYFAGIFSHFSAAFERRYSITKKQLSRFLKTVNSLTKAGYDVGVRHIANSCAALRFPETRLDVVRIGSALIGETCAKRIPIELKTAAVFKAQVTDRKILLKGDTTGYASVCKVKHDTDAVIAAIGYENGLGYMKRPDNFSLRDMAVYFLGVLRSCRRKPYVKYGNEKLYLLGRAGSQYSLFEIGNTDIKPGEYVTARPNMFFPNGRRVFR